MEKITGGELFSSFLAIATDDETDMLEELALRGGYLWRCARAHGGCGWVNDANEDRCAKCGKATPMELFPDALRALLPPIGATAAAMPRAVMVFLKFFDPSSGWCWYVMEGEATGGEEDDSYPDYMFFGFVKGVAQEYRTFMLSDLEQHSSRPGVPIERDLTFEPALLPVVAAREGLSVALGEEEWTNRS